MKESLHPTRWKKNRHALLSCFSWSYLSLWVNMFFINLWTSFVENAVVGQSSVLNFSVDDRVKKCGESCPSLVKRQSRSASNMAHWTKKWNSVSIAGSETSRPGKQAQRVPGQVGHCGGGGGGRGPGRQYWQYLLWAGVGGLVCLPSSICSLWLLTRNLLRKQRWFLFLTKSK